MQRSMPVPSDFIQGQMKKKKVFVEELTERVDDAIINFSVIIFCYPNLPNMSCVLNELVNSTDLEQRGVH